MCPLPPAPDCMLPRRVLPWPTADPVALALPLALTKTGDGVKTVDAQGCTPLRHTTTAYDRQTLNTQTPVQNPVSTGGPKWTGWELSESAHAEAGQHNALTSRLHQCMLWGSMHSLKSTVWSYAIA